MKLIVDNKQRKAKTRAHTGAHLLNAELDKIIPGTKQAGSYVDEDIFRFDFTTNSPLTDSQIRQIEININDIIYKGLNVEKKEITFDEAIKLGAKAFFEDKYGDKVRVVIIGNSQIISIELCGGTHVNNTSDIGAFKIISQEAVASGIRRITAITGPKVAEYAISKDDFINSIGQKIGSTEKQIPDKLEKILKEFESIKSNYESLLTQNIGNTLKSIDYKSNNDFDIIINISQQKNLENTNFKDISTIAKSIFEGKSFVIYNNEGSFVLSKVGAKDYAKNNGLKGGGPDNIIQGKDSKILDLFK